jgi:hypothetical protein
MGKPASEKELSKKQDNATDKPDTTLSTQSSTYNQRRSLRSSDGRFVKQEGKDIQVVTPQAGKASTFWTAVPANTGTIRKVTKVSIPPTCVFKKEANKPPIHTMIRRSVSKKPEP